LSEKTDASIAAKSRAIAEKLRQYYGDHPPKIEVDVQAWHNKLFGRVPADEESQELFQAVCAIIETWHNERN